jgi:hypothetical protein
MVVERAFSWLALRLGTTAGRLGELEVGIVSQPASSH